VLVAALTALGLPGTATAASLTSDELERLGRGETVTRTQDLENDEHSYIGGVTYTVVNATEADVMAVLENVRAYERLLPRTKDATLVGVNDGDRYVQLRQGTALIDTTYTVRIRSARDGMQFWLDRSKPHGIADAWGFFRLAPLTQGPAGPRTLVTYGVLVDLGPGIVRELFSERIRNLMLSVPHAVRDYLAENRQKGR
jgi:hypothetical protein